jgi:hypothetical protein
MLGAATRGPLEGVVEAEVVAVGSGSIVIAGAGGGATTVAGAGNGGGGSSFGQAGSANESTSGGTKRDTGSAASERSSFRVMFLA